MIKKIIIIALGIFASVTMEMSAQNTADSVRSAIIDSRNAARDVAYLPFTNPVVNQFRSAYTLTNVNINYNYSDDSGTIDPRLGTGGRSFGAGAETYTKYKNSTLWGHGSYSNSVRRDVTWNETADYDLIYPYISADSVGGDLKCEQYYFGAGYAAHNGSWAWGGELSYKATLEYRDVDPRPRNIVGVLDLAVGAGYKIWGDYFASISLRLRKYKQTNDIDFKSEMGVDKIFHLTGLGTHYSRFDGTAYSTYYDGYRYGVSADVFPQSGRGAYLSCLVSRFTFRNILTDFNKLPLASVWHNAIEAEGGWLAPGKRRFWGISANLNVYRRHGTENIFGDVSSGMYPQIGANTMFADNYASASLRAAYGLGFCSVSRLSVNLSGGWERRTMAYIEPYQYTLTNATVISASLKGDFALPHSWLVSARAEAKIKMPFDCSSQLAPIVSGDEMAGLVTIEHSVYELSTRRRVCPAIAINAGRPLAGKYTLNLGASWCRTAYCGGPHTDNVAAEISLFF